jgi:magnesium transporter
MPLKRFFHVTPQGKLIPVETLEAAQAAAKTGGYLWLDFFEPSREDLTALIEPLGIHPLAVESCLDEDQVPRFNEFPSHSFVLFNRARYRDGVLTIDEIDAFLGKSFLITSTRVGEEETKRIAAATDEAVRTEMESARRGPDFLLHIILDRAIDDTFAAIEALEEEIGGAEESILREPQAFRPEELIRLRRVLLALRKSLLHEREVLVKICRKDSPYVGEKAIYHFRDVSDHLTKFYEVVEIGREMITSLMEMYLSLINNRMAKAANNTNRAVRRLTLITTVFMPLTLLAGVGGMSEWSMMTGPANWRTAYPLFLAAMAVLGIVNYWLIKRMERRDREDG